METGEEYRYAYIYGLVRSFLEVMFCGGFISWLLLLAKLTARVVDCDELPVVSAAQFAAAAVHLTEGCVATQATNLVLMSALTVLRLFGKWKKLQASKAHVFPSYALRQHMRVKRLGLLGWGNIGPGCRRRAIASVARCLRIVLP